ncbi:phosphate/phosphite/phosphonate ABC transporter substrate-binding protein [Protaetiibacter intestinalis]|uniref:Phosphate/phosphite/phosphonate ABC transporter substrate-binding protein n=1 Tax=Protaetiibacter intestinalis TaxID=2419774 RepID=A0A387B309_9MICO|nr:phosphate/phosphite/phosphonate ABC transporter substrate-binding protein [Protaetiibacter intestinalis]AYF97932.1 phosphate/phosphite/phosphonate ABC transporter substrate-binding protein [Protaetiibacter intestinalis]
MKNTATRLASLGAAALVLAALVGCSSTPATGDDTAPVAETGTYASGDEGTLVFGVVPDTESTQNNWAPLGDYIAEITGKKVNFFEAADYTALIEAAIAGKIDVAAFSGFTYYQAWKNGAEITPFAGQLTGELTEPGYYSVAIANPNAGITTLADFAGKNICFVSETSTSGRLFPSKALKEAGVDPTSGLTPVFAGKHDASAEKVAAGTECVAGFAEDAVADPMIEAGEVVEIDRQLVPGAPLVYSNALPQSVIDILVDKLSDMTFQDMVDAGVEVADVDAAKEWFAGTKPVDDSYYDQIRDLCAELPELETCQ